MSAFALGVIASIIGSAVFALVSAYFASRFRKQVTAVLSALLGTGVEAVYSNEEEAASDLVRYARTSQTVCILNMRAFSLLDERRPLHFLLRPDQRVDRTVRILISDPNSPAVDARASEISAVEPTYNLDRYRANITDSLRVLTGLARGNSRLSVRLSTAFPAFGLMLTDDAVFVSFFLADKIRSHGPQYRIARVSPLYRGFQRYFETLWQAAGPAEVVAARAEQAAV